MSKTIYIFLFLIIIFSGCVSINKEINTSQVELPTINNPELPLRETAIPSPTFTPFSTPEPQLGHWLINIRNGDSYSSTILGKDLKTILNIGKYWGEAYLDQKNCNVIEISPHFEIKDGYEYSKGFDLNFYNLYGEILDKQILLLGHNPKNVYEMKVAPNMKWLAYKETSDWEGLYSIWDSHSQDVFLILIDYKNQSDAIKVTKNSGAWHASISWSPNGQYLAFTDFDDSGVQQLFIYDVVSDTTKQITRLQNLNLNTYVFDFLWGNDSKKLAFVSGQALNNENQFLPTTNALGLIQVDTEKLIWIIAESEEVGIELIDIGLSGILFFRTPDDKYNWFDINTNKVIHQFTTHEDAYFYDDLLTTVYFGGNINYQRYNINEGEFQESGLKIIPGFIHVIRTLENRQYFVCSIPALN
jgi:hypothetical protein